MAVGERASKRGDRRRKMHGKMAVHTVGLSQNSQRLSSSSHQPATRRHIRSVPSRALRIVRSRNYGICLLTMLLTLVPLAEHPRRNYSAARLEVLVWILFEYHDAYWVLRPDLNNSTNQRDLCVRTLLGAPLARPLLRHRSDDPIGSCITVDGSRARSHRGSRPRTA